MFTRVPLETNVFQMCHWAVDCAVAAALAVVCVAAAATLLDPVGHCAVYVSHDETAPPHQSMQFFTDLQWRDSIPSANLTWSSMTRRHSLTSKLLQLRLGKPGLSICRVICRFPQLLQNWGVASCSFFCSGGCSHGTALFLGRVQIQDIFKTNP